MGCRSLSRHGTGVGFSDFFLTGCKNHYSVLRQNVAVYGVGGTAGEGRILPRCSHPAAGKAALGQLAVPPPNLLLS